MISSYDEMMCEMNIFTTHTHTHTHTHNTTHVIFLRRAGRKTFDLYLFRCYNQSDMETFLMHRDDLLSEYTRA